MALLFPASGGWFVLTREPDHPLGRHNYCRIVPGMTRAEVEAVLGGRRKEPGKKPGSLCSPSTINKDLRHIAAALRKAKKWENVKEAPDFALVKVPHKLPRYVIPEHFAAIYQACETARMPEGQGFTPADWRRALVVFVYMTGWRIGDMLAFRRNALDLEQKGTALTLAEDNKGTATTWFPCTTWLSSTFAGCRPSAPRCSPGRTTSGR